MNENFQAARVAPRPIGKVRNPLVVLLLMIVTLGIYGTIWCYCIFEELRNYRGQGWSGLLYLVFQFLFPLSADCNTLVDSSLRGAHV